ncbi:MAG: MBOAT family protein [Bacteroidales bacterium]|nr:MBOAT family protein [Bacteroidales bacterium]
MAIISLYFPLLTIISIFIFYLLNHKYRVGFLALLSCSFIATYSYYLLLYVVVYAIINFFLGIKIPNSRFKTAIFRSGIIINLSQLIILKYADFTIDPLFQLFNTDLHISGISEIIIPVGVSFFTMQGIGYLVNIKMGWEKPEKRFLDFLLYITFFPKYLSGPIERSNHFLPQLKINKFFNEQQVTEGVRIALIGFFKKIVIADQLANIVNNAYTNIDAADGVYLWVVIFIQPLYLYFDFSGYTDIAIGFAKTFGIQLLPNFNRPFLSENVTGFWRRMHMSLSFWFNDYVFKQLSFKYRRWGKYASVFAVFVTFALFGIWHGAGWNFMVLGLLQAAAINFEFFTKKKRSEIFSKLPGFTRVWTGRILTYIFFSVSHVFFFTPDIDTAFRFFSKLNTTNSLIRADLTTSPFLLALFLSCLFLLIEVLKNDFPYSTAKIESYILGDRIIFKFLRVAFYYLMILTILVFRTKTEQFIYFQF